MEFYHFLVDIVEYRKKPFIEQVKDIFGHLIFFFTTYVFYVQYILLKHLRVKDIALHGLVTLF